MKNTRGRRGCAETPRRSIAQNVAWSGRRLVSSFSGAGYVVLSPLPCQRRRGEPMIKAFRENSDRRSSGGAWRLGLENCRLCGRGTRRHGADANALGEARTPDPLADAVIFGDDGRCRRCGRRRTQNNHPGENMSNVRTRLAALERAAKEMAAHCRDCSGWLQVVVHEALDSPPTRRIECNRADCLAGDESGWWCRWCGRRSGCAGDLRCSGGTTD